MPKLKAAPILKLRKTGIQNGVAAWENAVLMTRVFDDTDLTENRVGGLLWGMSRAEKSIGLLVDEYSTIVIKDSLIKNLGDRSVLVLDASVATSKDSSRVKIGSSQDYRQCIAFDKYRWHVVAPQYGINWINRTQIPTTIRMGRIFPSGSFQLIGTYPNPFNGNVKFQLKSDQSYPIEYKIYNILGRIGLQQ